MSTSRFLFAAALNFHAACFAQTPASPSPAVTFSDVLDRVVVRDRCQAILTVRPSTVGVDRRSFAFRIQETTNPEEVDVMLVVPAMKGDLIMERYRFRIDDAIRREMGHLADRERCLGAGEGVKGREPANTLSTIYRH